LPETVSVGVRLTKELLDFIDDQARKEKVDRSVVVRKFIEKGIAAHKKEKAAELYVGGKISISGAAELANLTIPEMVEYLVAKGYRSSYALDNFRKGLTLLEKKNRK